MAGRNVLVFHAGALGDFVLSWPLLLGAARTMAQCRVIVITGADKGRLAERVLGVESRDAEGGWHLLFGEPATADTLPERPAKLLAGARLVISFAADDVGTWAANVRRLAPEADVRLLKPRPAAGSGVHAVDFLLSQLEPDPILHAATAGIVAAIRNGGLMPRAHDAAGPIVVHPGSGSPAKNWPAQRWAELIRSLDRPARVVLGEVERDTMPAAWQDALATAAGEVRRPENLLELLDALTGASAYAGHDSGPTHLAATLGLPTLALFGPTDPATWAPSGPRVDVLRHEPLSDLPVEHVRDALARLAR